jgi:hypothetical protein
MIYVTLVIALAIFMGLFHLFGLIPTAKRALEIVVEAADALRSKTLSEESKEIAAREAAIASMFAFLSTVMRASAAIAVPALFLSLGIAAKVYSLTELMTAISDWRFILGSTLGMLIVWGLAP